MLAFQYISCYCLSFWNIFIQIKQIVFQYISCYCLSILKAWYTTCVPGVSIHLMLLFIQNGDQVEWYDPRFNTSHVTVYLLRTTKQELQLHCFNTSHVTVYHIRQYRLFLSCTVSIHLMLLFINSQFINFSCQSTFQYISCYCLSHKQLHSLLLH